MKVTKFSSARLGLGFCLMLMAGSVNAGWTQLNMPRGASRLASEVYDLHMLILWICTAIGFLVFGLILWSVIWHRKSRGVKAASFQHNTTLEIVWTVIPMVTLIAMAVPATRVLIDQRDTSDSALTVQVTGYQWMWGYEYIDEDVQFLSRLDREANRVRQLGSGLDPREVPHYLQNVDNPLVVPTNQKVRFLLTSNDVIHSWWVPEFGWKRDAIPGYINETWVEIEEPGTYRGQCAELCGRDHAFMPIVVVAKPPEEFQAWLEAQRNSSAASNGNGATAQAGVGPAAVEETEAVAEAETLSIDDLISQGETVYQQNCAVCHQPNGQGMGVFPALAGSEFVNGEPRPVVENILNGRGAMPPFAHLSDNEIAAVATFVRNSFGNETGDAVQPADVQAAR